MRTPLNSMIAMNIALGFHVTSEDGKYYLKVQDSSCKLLLSYANDMIDLQKIKMGSFTPENAEFSVTQMIQEVEEILRQNYSDKQLTLTYQILGDDIINSDIQRIQQVLINLV